MKKFVKNILLTMVVFGLFITGNMNIVSAKESMDKLDDIVLIPDNIVTDDMIEVGEEYAKEMNGDSRLRMDEEVWTLKSSTTVVSHGSIKAGFGDIVPVGESRTKTCSWSVSSGTNIKGYTLGASVSGSKSITQSGPSSSDKLADGKKATHRAFFSVGYGRLVKYTYEVTQKYSGNFVRTETRYMYSDVSTVSCSQLIMLNGSTVYVEDVTGTKVKSAGTLSNYKSKFSAIDGTCLAYYKW